MKSGIYELSVFVQSIRSTKLQQTKFYSIILRAGSKAAQISQKKSPTEPNLISFSQTLNLKLTQEQLQAANQQASLQVYSVHNYGDKKLLGQLQLFVELINQKQFKARFTLNSDSQAQINLKYGLFKIQSRVLSQKSCLSGVSRSSTPKQAKPQLQNNFIALLLNSDIQSKKNQQKSSTVSNSRVENQFKTCYSQEIAKKRGDDKTACSAIQEQLKLMQSCENALLKCKKSQKKLLSPPETHRFNGQGQKSDFMEKVKKLTGNLNKVHEKEEMLQNEQQIEDLVNIQMQKSGGSFNYKIQSLLNKQQVFQNLLEKNKQNKQGIQYDYQRQSPRTSNKNSKIQLNGSFSPQTFDQNVSFANFNPLSITDAGHKQKKLSLVKPKTKIDSYQEWENDDNLRNVVRQNIDEVKGCNGFIKLSKLLFLRKKYEDSRKSNKLLSNALNVLIENEFILKKKLQISEKIIKQKEEILVNQLNLLKNQFKEVSNKLLDKYKEEAFREQKLKEAQLKNQNYQKQIKELNHQLEAKTKLVQHLRQALIHYEQQAAPAELKKQESKKQSKQKEPKFKRNPSNSIFKPERQESLGKKKVSTEKDKSSLLLSSPFSKQYVDEFKGINPVFIDFFTSFRTKNTNESIEQGQSYLKGQNKINRLNAKNRNLDSYLSQVSINNRSGIQFKQI